MFCPKCGTQLTGTETFCHECGNRVAPAAEQAAVTEEPIIAEEPVVTVPEEEPVISDEALDEILAQEAAAEEVPEEAAAPQIPETTHYSNPVPPVQKPKKSRKLLAILIPILAVVLIAAAVGGVFFLANTNYEQAVACLEEKEYEEALELFGKFSFYKDSKEQIAELERQQSEYDEANDLLQDNEYVEALDMFKALGDYRDSKNILETEAPYQQACYLMESAANGDSEALSQLPGYEEDGDVAITLYQGAAEIFLELGEYEDSAANASHCYLQAAFTYMEQGLFEDAMTCQDHLNDADKETFIAQYMTYCADEAVLADLDAAVRARYDMEAAYWDDPYMTDLDLIESEWEILEKYSDTEGLMFYDAELEELLAAYIGGLAIEASVIEDDEFFYDYGTWYTGTAARYAVVEVLIEKYDFLGDAPDLQASYAGQAEYYLAAAALEFALDEQLIGVDTYYSEEYGDYFLFENTTGYEFTLTLGNEYCDDEYNTVFYHETDPIHIGIGETVELYFQFPNTDDWTIWYTSWDYDIVLP